MSLQINLGGPYALVLGEPFTSIMIVCAVSIVILSLLIFARVQRTKVRLLLITLVLITLPILALCVPVSWYVARSMLVPAETAETALPNLEATIGLEFYELDWSNHSGRYLVVRNAAGEIRQGMSAFDWVHWPRTSIYLIGDGRVAVLGPTYDDYVVEPKRRTIDGLRHGTRSDTWTYLGAFDFKNRKLVFIPASEQRECTATRGITDPSATRPQGRFDECYQEELKN
jgi:hypothetical protein